MSDADTGFCARPERPSYETQDGLYDVAWSEIHENQLVTGSGDGSIKLWDIMIKVGLRDTKLRRTQFLQARLGSPDPCLARAHPRSLLCRLVQYQQGPIHLFVLGWDGKARTSVRYYPVCFPYFTRSGRQTVQGRSQPSKRILPASTKPSSPHTSPTSSQPAPPTARSRSLTSVPPHTLPPALAQTLSPRLSPRPHSPSPHPAARSSRSTGTSTGRSSSRARASTRRSRSGTAAW